MRQGDPRLHSINVTITDANGNHIPTSVDWEEGSTHAGQGTGTFIPSVTGSHMVSLCTICWFNLMFLSIWLAISQHYLKISLDLLFLVIWHGSFFSKNPAGAFLNSPFCHGECYNENQIQRNVLYSSCHAHYITPIYMLCGITIDLLIINLSLAGVWGALIYTSIHIYIHINVWEGS